MKRSFHLLNFKTKTLLFSPLEGIFQSKHQTRMLQLKRNAPSWQHHESDTILFFVIQEFGFSIFGSSCFFFLLDLAWPQAVWPVLRCVLGEINERAFRRNQRDFDWLTDVGSVGLMHAQSGSTFRYMVPHIGAYMMMIRTVQHESHSLLRCILKFYLIRSRFHHTIGHNSSMVIDRMIGTTPTKVKFEFMS